jgi:effector-binding domain-containing protein
LGEQPAGPFFAVYYNDDMQNLDVGIGFIVSQLLPGKDEIQPSEIPAGSYAACLYTGPYSHIKEAYDTLGKWLQDNGRQATQVAYEMYLDDPSKTLPAQLRTIVMQPLQ